MSDWSTDPDTGIPSPELVAAWLELDTLPTERVPLWAAHWLTAGYDGVTLGELAGLHGNDPREVRDLLPSALTECGVTTPDSAVGREFRERAAAVVAFNAIAQLHLDGRASAFWVVQTVVEIAEPLFQSSITNLPLGALYLLEDEWGAGWGRTEAQLCDAVREACLAQLERPRHKPTRPG
jgi:hypothetical protein